MRCHAALRRNWRIFDLASACLGCYALIGIFGFAIVAATSQSGPTAALRFNWQIKRWKTSEAFLRQVIMRQF